MNRRQVIHTTAMIVLACAAISAQSSDMTSPGKGKKGIQNEKTAAARESEFNYSAIQEILKDDPLNAKTLVCAPESERATLSTWFDEPAEYFYEWGTNPDELDHKTEIAKAGGRSSVKDTLCDLNAGSRWYYRLHWKNAEGWHQSAVASFTTARASGQPFSFIIEADPHLDDASSAARYRRNLAYMKSLNPDFVMDLGDASMAEKLSRNLEEARQRNLCLRSFWDDIGNDAPFFMVLGNHDGEFGWKQPETALSDAEDAKIRRSVFANPVPSKNGFYTGVSDTAYAFAWGDALIVVLDPYNYTFRKGKADNWDWTLGREQYDWLAKTLESSTARYRFVFIHNLVGGSGKDNRGGAEAARLWEWGGKGATETDDFALKRAGWPMPIHDLLVKGKVDIVFHGHDHFYAREEKDGIIYQIVPQPSLKMRQNAAEIAAEYGYKNADIAASPGFIRVRVTPTGATVELRDAGAEGAVRSYTVAP